MFTLVTAYTETDVEQERIGFRRTPERLTEQRVSRAATTYAARDLDDWRSRLQECGSSFRLRHFDHLQSGAEYRDWLKLPPLTDPLLADLIV